MVLICYILLRKMEAENNNNKNALKLHKQNNIVLNVEGKFCPDHDGYSPPEDLTQLGIRAIKLLNDKNLEVSKVRPFFWSLVETYVDRFQFYPFDASKALFNHLELKNYPEDVVKQLIKELEIQFEKSHGRPLRKSTQLLCPQDALDDEIKELRDSLKYAVMVGEGDELE